MPRSPVDPATALPLRLDDILLEAVDTDDEQLWVRLVVFEDDDVVDVKEQPVSWATLELTNAAELATRVRARLARGDPRVMLPWDLLRKPSPYRPVGPFEEPDPRMWLQAVVDAIREQALERGFDARFESLEDWPPEAVHAYFLWLAVAMLGGNGLEGFLLQAQLEDVMGVLAALEAAGCRALATRYREGLAVTASGGGAEFLLQVDERWLEEHTVGANERATPWSAIDHWREGGTYWLIERELQPALAEYVGAHRQRLVAG